MSDRIPTLADLCCAIAEGRIAAAIDDNMYQVNALELRRYFNEFRSLPAFAQFPAPLSDPNKWSTSSRTSVA